MKIEDAIAWMKGERCSCNNTEVCGDNSLWEVRTAQADAAYMEQAYWCLKAHAENLVPPNNELSVGESSSHKLK